MYMHKCENVMYHYVIYMYQLMAQIRYTCILYYMYLYWAGQNVLFLGLTCSGFISDYFYFQQIKCKFDFYTSYATCYWI